MKILKIPKKFLYDGSQLRSLFAYENYKVLGSSVVCWQGPCRVDFEHMVDGEDLIDRSKIQGDMMLHFLFEIFDRDLHFAVAYQRLCVSLLKDFLHAKSPVLAKKIKEDPRLGLLVQSGDDLYWQNRKLSISVATKTSNSVMIHLALNISNKGTPVPTVSLQDLGVKPDVCAAFALKAFQEEFVSMTEATQKVFPV